MNLKSRETKDKNMQKYTDTKVLLKFEREMVEKGVKFEERKEKCLYVFLGAGTRVRQRVEMTRRLCGRYRSWVVLSQ